MILKWQLNNTEGECELQEVTHIVTDCNEIIETAKATLHIEVAEKMFFNGYQTWSWCPEYDQNDYMYGVRAPKEVNEANGFDRYGDYHFYNYSNEKGQFHGYSYCYFRNGENYRFFGSLDERNGYTVFSYDCDQQLLTIERDCQGVRGSENFHLLDLYYKEGSEQEVFDGWFTLLNIKPITNEHVVGYSSWYNRYENINEEAIIQDLEGCRKVLKAGDLFQVDDGWEPTVGDWLEGDKKKFPHGMKTICDQIHEKGYKAGIWLAPMVTTAKSTIYRDHPDWLIKHEGEYWSNGSNWGGFYSLDFSKEEVKDHLRKVFDCVLNDWGFDLVKLDFLYAGAIFNNEKASRGAQMIEIMDFIRELCGDKEILGCGVPLFPAFGKVEYCRISCDVSLDWDDKPEMVYGHRERISTKHATDNSILRRQLNGRAFLNDPDVFFLREDNLYLSEEEKQYLYTINALSGGVLLTSDDPGRYDDKKVELFNKIRKLNETASWQLRYDPLRIEYEEEGVKQELIMR